MPQIHVWINGSIYAFISETNVFLYVFVCAFVHSSDELNVESCWIVRISDINFTNKVYVSPNLNTGLEIIGIISLSGRTLVMNLTVLGSNPTWVVIFSAAKLSIISKNKTALSVEMSIIFSLSNRKVTKKSTYIWINYQIAARAGMVWAWAIHPDFGFLILHIET